VSGVGTYVLSLVLVVTVGSYMLAVSVLGAASTTAALVPGLAHVRLVDLVYRAVCACSGLNTLVLSVWWALPRWSWGTCLHSTCPHLLSIHCTVPVP
jgi:hypothetical protein